MFYKSTDEELARELVRERFPGESVILCFGQNYQGMYEAFGLAGNKSFCAKFTPNDFAKLTPVEMADFITNYIKEKT